MQERVAVTFLQTRFGKALFSEGVFQGRIRTAIGIDYCDWHREIWNEGFAPLLWVVSPTRIDLYNGFGTPSQGDNARENLIRSFENVEASLREADALRAHWNPDRRCQRDQCLSHAADKVQ